jgi:Na+-translocating ferredoxin:NAD+ oxidoreductase RnfG subunit
MSGWSRWTLPPAAVVMTVMQPVYAVEYLGIVEAQRLSFPEATRFLEANVIYRPADIQAIEKLSGQKVLTRGEQVWKAEAGARLLGYFIIDYVIGKHLAIDYAVALDPDGRVRRVEILQYRESYGGEIANADWLAQFIGKTAGDRLEVGRDIRNISGATLSSRHVTEGIKRVLALYDVCLK